jgi:hypothetical protein
MNLDSASVAELREERGQLATWVAELETGQLRHVENGADISAVLLAEWRSELAHIDRVLGRARV